MHADDPRDREIPGDISSPGQDFCRAMAALDESTAVSQSGDSPETPVYSSARYSLIRPLGRGGMGQVWLAHDAILGREVALKELRRDRAEDRALRRRLLREAQITSRLQHPGIVPVYDLVSGPNPGQTFYIMRLVQGQTLRRAALEFHAERTRTSRFRALISAFVQVCHTLAYAHHHGVIHRDLKGDNVVLGDFGEVIVLDWGLARIHSVPAEYPAGSEPDAAEADSLTTLDGQIIGTPGYMAPEQAAGRIEQIGPCTDVHGLGALLYLLLTGEPPHRGADLPELLRRVRQEAPAPPQRFWPGVPPALSAICLKALARDPEQRYAGAVDLAADVQRWLDDEPVSVYRESLPARMNRWARRHRTLVSTAGVLVLTTLIALIVGMALLRQEERKTAAEAERARRAELQARESLRQGLQAIDQSLTRISEGVLLRTPGMQPVRYDLLRSALSGYQSLLDTWKEDPLIRAEVAQAWHRLGSIAGEISREKDALELFEKAYEIQEALYRQDPTDRQHRLHLASTLYRRGCLHRRLGRLPQAVTDLQQAHQLYAEIVPEPEAPASERALLLNSLGLTQANLARSLLEAERETEARPAYSLAVRSLEQAVELFPQKATLRLHLVDVLKEQAFFLRHAGETIAARSAAIRARDILQHLPESEQALPTVLKVAGDTWNLLALLHRELGESAETTVCLQTAVAVRQKLVRENPDVAPYRADCASSLFNLARSHLDAGRTEPARAALGSAGKLFEQALEVKADVPYYRTALARTYLLLAHLQGQDGLADELRVTQQKCEKLLPDAAARTLLLRELGLTSP